jgi:hypothetical protein
LKNKIKRNLKITLANLTELQKLTGEKTSNEISQANMLVPMKQPLTLNKLKRCVKKLMRIHQALQNLGGLSNAEEKENEALAKQQKALELLAKTNPTYKVKTLDDGSNPAAAIANVNSELNKAVQSQVDAYLALSKANQNELKLQGDKLSKNSSFKNPTNKQAQDLKTSSDNLNNEAKALIAKSATATSPSEKANLLLKANEKEIESIKALQQANEALNGTNNVVATNNNSENNSTTNTNNNKTSNPNATNTNTTAVS